MSARAYVLIEVAPGAASDVIAALRAMPAIISADAVTGPYDIIAVIETDASSAVGALVIERIRPVQGINRTMTCLVLQ